MSNPQITRKVNDLLPYVDVTLKDADGAFDLSGYDHVRFVMASTKGTVIADQSSTGSNVVLLNSTGGRVRWKPQSSEVDTPGNYIGEYEAYLATGESVTFPNNGHLDIALRPEIST
jgi:hypothetical protein